jgi:hypothetical protein
MTTETGPTASSISTGFARSDFLASPEVGTHQEMVKAIPGQAGRTLQLLFMG